MLTVYSPDHLYQNAQFELIDGQLLPPVDTPKRVEAVLEKIEAIKLGEVLPAQEFGLDPILRVHEDSFVNFLQNAWSDWVKEYGEKEALPLNWPARTLRQDKIPEAIDGKLGYYSFDAGTPITAGTWRAAKASANVALTAQQLLKTGEKTVFALCRPPGHHAAKSLYGGYCFLNNAAIATQALLDAGAQRVGILDVDYHHGNGTQDIFYHRNDVLFVSLHADPRLDYPFYLGYEDETGIGQGEGFNFNYPLPWGIRWPEYCQRLKQGIDLMINYSPDVLVVSLGVDTYEHDPIAKFALTTEDYLSLGKMLASINKPTLWVMEGGYAVPEIGNHITNVLIGFEDN
ncbi:histone deacetylase superfamily [Gloeothece citriformis PCC 7424]|uniref:Histone deacetylase superfamily n=1 Tax=Gloeothece citriformis (strain PCC 7424) TaxID=65393 RepID=B7KDC0_GLOC7|nr:histone deacetylase family protein [Gloeothece citriformis]ACK68940.1 histone deacetylase superfamily [Gloeothece citriformis PCC 7424]